MLESKPLLHFVYCSLDVKPCLQMPGYLAEGSFVSVKSYDYKEMTEDICVKCIIVNVTR